MSDYGIKTYADLAETCGNMVLANEMAKRPLELVSGDRKSTRLNSSHRL